MRSRLAGWRTSFVLVLAGAILVACGLATPLYTDALAYQAAIDGINASVGDEAGDDWIHYSQEFMAAGDRFATLRWPLVDTGYSLLAWAALAAALRVALPDWRWRSILRPTTDRGRVFAFGLAGLVLLGVGILASRLHPLTRDQLPPWADSVIISIGELGVLLVFAAPVVLAMTVGRARGQQPPSSSILAFASDSPSKNFRIGLLYAGPVLFSAFLAVKVWEPGAWAISPGAAIMCWLFLNGRALSVAAPPDPVAATKP